MKLITIKGEWVLFDSEKEITVTDGCIAFAYAMLMAEVRPHKCITPSIYPVRSLVPHPKKRKLSKKWRDKAKAIKYRLQAQTI